MLVDSHCHLNFPDYKHDLPQVLENARALGVGLMQTICTHMEEFDTVYAIAEAYPQVYASVGVHPNRVADAPMAEAAEIFEKTKLPKVIGIGETGLDYYYENSPREQQQESFRRHIAAAQQSGLPVIIHTRAAEEDTLAILRETQAEKSYKGLIHCFSADMAFGRACIEMGLYISIPGIVTFKKAEALQEAVKGLPLERMLVETDAPYLAPIPYRGKRNEPGYTRYAAEKVAELKGLPLEEVARITTANFFTLFDKADPANAIAA